MCSQKHIHETQGVLYKHKFFACWSSEGKVYPHSQLDCRKKKQVVLGMCLCPKSHTHKDRVVINKAYHVDQISHLQNLSKYQANSIFIKSYVNKKDHISYGSVVQHSKGQSQSLSDTKQDSHKPSEHCICL